MTVLQLRTLINYQRIIVTVALSYYIVILNYAYRLYVVQVTLIWKLSIEIGMTLPQPNLNSPFSRSGS